MTPRIIAHRGSRINFPENSVEAINAAFESGAEGVEVDVDLTLDGKALLIHQEGFEFDVVSNRLITAPSGPEAGWLGCLPYSSAKTIDCASWYYGEGSKGSMPPGDLKDLIVCAAKGRSFYLELKDPDYWAGQASKRAAEMAQEAAQTALRLCKQSSEVYILSFSPAMLREAQAVIPNVPRLMLIDGQFGPLHSQSAREQGCVGVVFPLSEFSAGGYSLQAAAHGFEIYVYEDGLPHIKRGFQIDARLEEMKRHWRQLTTGVHGIITDFPEQLKSFLSSN
ncbi:MAG: hypothetical protein J5J00_03385 [Deltaproteobacteria bacterium]|nr:hypothetical protein [Deltaproteobacteria bacterium]